MRRWWLSLCQEPLVALALRASLCSGSLDCEPQQVTAFISPYARSDFGD
jgi:hypothetical protein